MRRGRLFLLAAVAGAAAALGHAPFGLWPVSLAGFAILIRLVACGDLRGVLPSAANYVPQAEERSNSRSALWTAWFGGVGYFAVALHWIVEPFLVDVVQHGWMAPFALVLMAGGLALFWALAGWISAQTRWPAIGFAVALTLVELGRGYVLTGFPWALPAYIWTDTLLIRMAAHIGPYGLTFATLLIAALTVSGRRLWHRGLLFSVAAVFGAGMFAEGSLRELIDEQDGGGLIRLVQPNAPQHEKWNPEKAQIFVERIISFSGEPAEKRPEMVVWPESAIPYPLDVAAPVLSRAAATANGTKIVTGINRRSSDGDWFNSLIVVEQDGTVSEAYDKVHLVPFGEYIPLRIDLLRRMAGFSGFGFTPGPEVRLVDTPLGRAMPLICYEAIFPTHGLGVGERPDYLLQVTNDAWFGTFSGPYQHLQQAQFRAAEQGLPFVRVANTGVSAVIDPLGRIRNRLPLGEAGWYDAEMPGRLPPTIYSRTGDAPTLVILLVIMAGLFAASRRNGIANGRASS